MLVGQKFNHLTIIEDLGQIEIRGRKRRYVLVQCDCDRKTIKKIRRSALSYTLSCGCRHHAQATKIKQFIGKKIHHFTILEDLGTRERYRHYVKVQCDCDAKTIKEIVFEKLFRGTISCGCSSSDSIRKLLTTHGKTKTKEFNCWQLMRKRCKNINDPRYSYYGGSGITVCPAWDQSFEQFLSDMGEAPSPIHSIERLDNTKGYFPDNCKWGTPVEQANNKRSNRIVEYNGRCQNLTQWSHEIGIRADTLRNRLDKLNWDVVRTFTTPVKGKYISP